MKGFVGIAHCGVEGYGRAKRGRAHPSQHAEGQAGDTGADSPKHANLRQQLGSQAKQSVADRFLITERITELEEYLLTN